MLCNCQKEEEAVYGLTEKALQSCGHEEKVQKKIYSVLPFVQDRKGNKKIFVDLPIFAKGNTGRKKQKLRLGSYRRWWQQVGGVGALL